MSRYGTENLFSMEPADESACSHTIRVAFAAGVDQEFDYLVPDELWPIEPGQRVRVPFGRSNKKTEAFCVAVIDQERSAQKNSFRLKKVIELIDENPLIDSELLDLSRWISSYYVCPLGQVLAAVVPAAVKKGVGIKKQKFVFLKSIGDENAEKPRGPKQKGIVEYLRHKAAFNEESAVEIEDLYSDTGCSLVSVKGLVRKQIVGIMQKEVLRSLPAIPEQMAPDAAQVTLNEDQQKALDWIAEKIEAGEFAVGLLHGVTDSGKTEVYIRAIQKVVEKGKSAIVLVPEIALTAQTVQRFSSRFENVAVLHSHLTAAQRHAEWQKIKTGQSQVVIGARSAVFAPVKNLGLIVIDEEHEPSYKQDTVPRYNGRDVAIKRVQQTNGLCIVGSATPALETLDNCRTKEHFELLRLPRRVKDLPMPAMKLVDLKHDPAVRSGKRLISDKLAERLKRALEAGEQSILLLNRRGYSNFVYCPSCKHTLRCRNCDVSLTFHRRNNNKRMLNALGRHMNRGFAVCHYCMSKTLVPESCPLCGKPMTMIGLGSQRLEEELAERFGKARVARIDSDSMQGKDYYKILRDFGQGKIDILAGTQMLAKGLHFPNVTVVGIISADTSLYIPDFRSNERTFQLICQVAGRCGRGDKKGEVYVQTFMPDQPAIKYAMKNDFDGFVAEEFKHRKACNLPPFWRMAMILLRDENFDKLQQACDVMRSRLDNYVAEENLQANIRGPMPAAISRVQRFHRMQIIVETPDPRTMSVLFNRFRQAGQVIPAVKISIDIDPINLL